MLKKYLLGADLLTKSDNVDDPKPQQENDVKYIGSGMDCAVIPLRHHREFALVQTVDFFYPLCDDPHIMGQIALANVVSDVYAVGVTDIDKLNMLVTSPTELSEKERDTIVPMIVEGFRESAKLAKCRVGVQDIAINPWCIIGGIASSVCKQDEIIMPSNAKDGDLIVLTKPLGTQLATNAYLWMQDKNDDYKKLTAQFTDEDIQETFRIAVKSMTFLNRDAALLMHKYSAHAATDVTGFGLLGHARNLAEFQTESLHFIIDKLPIIKNVLGFGKILSRDMKLKAGMSVETSGGLLICLSAENAPKFCNEFKTVTNNEQNAWIVGRVVRAERRDAILDAAAVLIDVNF